MSSRKAEKDEKYLQKENELYQDSSKMELWNLAKSRGRASIVLAYCAGCAIARAVFPHSLDSLWAISIGYPLILILGAIIAVLLFAMISFLFPPGDDRIPIPLKVLIVLVVPAVIIILVSLLRNLPE